MLKEKNKSAPDQTRTGDLVINSHTLYLLSYGGKEVLGEKFCLNKFL